MSGLTWLASYPKSGNTWLRVFLANLCSGQRRPVDINHLSSIQFAARELWDATTGWETAELIGVEREGLRLAVQETLAKNVPGALVKTHEVFANPQDSLPRFSVRATCGVLYVLRNPLDVAVSLSHHLGQNLDETIAFMNDPAARLNRRPNERQEPQLLCDWSTHVRGWTNAHGMNVCVLRYEDMLASPENTFTRVAEAVGLAQDKERISHAVACSVFGELQRQEKVSGFVERTATRVFFRRGQSGTWRDTLTARQVDAVCGHHEQVMRQYGYLDAAGPTAT